MEVHSHLGLQPSREAAGWVLWRERERERAGEGG
jgi:hypothetical protein